jgi:dimethylargininase
MNGDSADVEVEDDDIDDVVDLTRAREQHQLYVQALRACVPVLDLPALQQSSTVSSESESTDEEEAKRQPQLQTTTDYPDCTFVEDTAIAIGGYALITRLGHISRRGEGAAIHSILQQLGMETLNMNDYYNSTEWRYGKGDGIQGELAVVDGGDVLYTGRHIYVGLSNRTNIEGALFIKQFFASYDVIVVPQVQVNPATVKQLPHPIPLHLKSAVTHIDPETLLAPMGPYGDQLLQAMNVYEDGYKVHRLPDLLSCNAVTCNGQVIVQDTLCERSQEILYQAVMDTDQDLILVDTSELAKKDGALTCCSILLDV